MFGMFNKEKTDTGKYKKPYYSLLSVHCDKVLDLSGGGEQEGNIIIWKSNKGENQSFAFSSCGVGEYNIKCKANGQFLTVADASNGARIYTAGKTNQPNQKFRIEEKEAGKKEHIIYTFCGKVLDICEASKKDGAQVIQYDFSGSKNQLWHFCDPKNITSSSSEIE